MSARSAAHARRPTLLAFSARRRRRLLALVVLAVALAVGYLGWLRDSSLVAVKEVRISGLTSPSADRIERAITAAGKEMTTLHVRPEVIEQAVAGFPVVDRVVVEADFPNALDVRVIEHRPVALVEAAGRRVPVAGDGTLLPDVEARGELPAVRVQAVGASGRLPEGRARSLVAIAGAAPRALLARAERIAAEPARGIVVALRDGPELIFGDGSRARAKWLAASAVLADESSRGASYVDLRLPERPAAGGLGAETVEPVGMPGAGAGAAPAAGAEPQPQVEGWSGG